MAPQHVSGSGQFSFDPQRLSFVVAQASSAVVIQRHIRGFLARILYEKTMLTNAHDGSPSLLEDESSASPSLLSISADATANSNTKESEADDSSVSSLSTSESMWDKGYHFPEAVTIPSTVAVAKPAIKSNPVVTQSSPCQRQAEPPTVDSPTSSVFSYREAPSSCGIK